MPYDPQAHKRAQTHELASLRKGPSPFEMMDCDPAYTGATFELVGGYIVIQLAASLCEDPMHPVTVRRITVLVDCECDLHSEGVCSGHTKSTYSRALVPGPKRRGQRRKWARAAIICDACYPHWEARHLPEWDVWAQEPLRPLASLEKDIAALLGDG